jgi:hypothetical protein
MPFLASSWKEPGTPEVKGGMTVPPPKPPDGVYAVYSIIVTLGTGEQAGSADPAAASNREKSIPATRVTTIRRCLIQTPGLYKELVGLDHSLTLPRFYKMIEI